MDDGKDGRGGAGPGKTRAEQGTNNPLMSNKTNRRAGVIFNASESKKPNSATFERLPTGPTRVIILPNMVGPGEVGDELEDKMASEQSVQNMAWRLVWHF